MFGSIEPSRYVFAALVPKFTFSGKKVNRLQRPGGRSNAACEQLAVSLEDLTKEAGLPGFRFHLRHCAITQLAENGTSDSTIMAIAGHVSRRMLQRYSHVRMEAERKALEALALGSKTEGYGTKHDTNIMPTSRRAI